MQTRMKNPARSSRCDEGDPADQGKAGAGVPATTLELVHLRASQINGCSPCVDPARTPSRRRARRAAARGGGLAGDAVLHRRGARGARTPRAVTRLADRPDAVPDDVWDEAAKHYDERGLAALILQIATTNLFNRLNATTRQPAGQNWG